MRGDSLLGDMSNMGAEGVSHDVTSATEGETQTSLPLDVALVVLGDPTRRDVLTRIGEYGPEESAEFEEEDFAERVGDREFDRVALYHRHLPKLDDAGFVDWDRESGVITSGPRYEEIRPLVRLIQGYRYDLPDDWP